MWNFFGIIHVRGPDQTGPREFLEGILCWPYGQMAMYMCVAYMMACTSGFTDKYASNMHVNNNTHTYVQATFMNKQKTGGGGVKAVELCLTLENT